MISQIYILESKLLFATKQGNAWRLVRAYETESQRRERINLIILTIEDDKEIIRQELAKLKNDPS